MEQEKTKKCPFNNVIKTYIQNTENTENIIE
jgi:hypothetical protein